MSCSLRRTDTGLRMERFVPSCLINVRHCLKCDALVLWKLKPDALIGFSKDAFGQLNVSFQDTQTCLWSEPVGSAERRANKVILIWELMCCRRSGSRTGRSCWDPASRLRLQSPSCSTRPSTTTRSRATASCASPGPWRWTRARPSSARRPRTA